MNANSDKFSIKRMWTVTGHYCVANSQHLIISSSVLFGLILLVSLLVTKMTSTEPDFRVVAISMFYVFAAGIVITVTGSLTFSSYASKPKRIAAMMLPATKAEKFMSMALVYNVFGNIILLLSMLLSDVLTAALFGLPSAVSYLPQIFYNDGDLQRFIPLVCLAVLWCFLISQAVYVVGSALWPKLSFLKTFIAMNALQILITILLPVYSLGDWFGNYLRFLTDYFDSVDKVYAASWCLLAICYAILAGVYALAWLRFRNLAVAKRFLS